MSEIIYVGIGGAAGAISRFLITKGFGNNLDNIIEKLNEGASALASLLLPTFSINMIACLLIGFLFPMLMSNKAVSSILLIGFLGGFSTFSTFGLESYRLIVSGFMFSALIYSVASLILGLLMVWVGFFVASLLLNHN